MYYYRDKSVTIRPLEEGDCAAFAGAFAAQGWDKQEEQYRRYLREQQAGQRQVLVALWQGELAGYLTLVPRAGGPFAGKPWPEVVDFNVLEKFQRRGIGGKLMDAVEALAGETSDVVCIGVGMYPGYGTAQRMYVKRGYIPDGSGLWYRDRPLPPMAPGENDDDLVLHFSKKLERRELRPQAGAERPPHPISRNQEGWVLPLEHCVGFPLKRKG